MNDAAVQRPEVLTLVALAEYLDCHVSTIYRLVKTDQLPGFRIGGSGGNWRFLRSQIDEWIANQHGRSVSPGHRGRRGRTGPPTPEAIPATPKIIKQQCG